MATAAELPRLSLRQRKHAATVAEIKEVALRQMAADSAASLSLRAVARELGTSVQALYHYYPGRDALITDLVTDAFGDFHEALERVADRHAASTPEDRLVEVGLAYRTWARRNRARFLLIYGDPIPGYAAPDPGPTTSRARRLGALFARLLFDGWPQPDDTQPDPTTPRLAATLDAAADLVAPGLSAPQFALLIESWGRLHGLVLLGLHAHVPWLAPEPVAEEFVRSALRRLWDDVQQFRGRI